MNDRSKDGPKNHSIRAENHSIAIGGDAKGAKLHVGDEIHIHGHVDLERFRAELATLRAAVPGAGLDAESAETIEGEIVDVEAEVAKSKPNKTKVLARLDTIGRIAAAAATVGDKLVPAARTLGEMAGRLF